MSENCNAGAYLASRWGLYSIGKSSSRMEGIMWSEGILNMVPTEIVHSI